METAKGRIQQCQPALRPSERRAADHIPLRPGRGRGAFPDKVHRRISRKVC